MSRPILRRGFGNDPGSGIVSEIGTVFRSIGLKDTAHPPPFWPVLLTLIYHAFGMTTTAGYVRALVGICSYSALYALLPLFGRKLGLGRRAGIFAGVAGALVPLQGLAEATGIGLTAHMCLAFAALAIAFRHRWSIERPSAAS